MDGGVLASTQTARTRAACVTPPSPPSDARSRLAHRSSPGTLVLVQYRLALCTHTHMQKYGLLAR